MTRRPNGHASLERLLDGVERFQREVFAPNEAHYRQLVREGQKPHTLFITCADSRIDPEALTQSAAGEIFVCRNVGNIVPSYGGTLGGVAAVIEYAVVALGVEQIVICGHSDCGAMHGLLHPSKLEPMPSVKEWLRYGHAAASIVHMHKTKISERAAVDLLIEENVLLQLHHLESHPYVSGRVANGSLLLSGWVYDIERGTVRIYDEAARRFKLLEEVNLGIGNSRKAT
jgi:carbonic anhydrase